MSRNRDTNARPESIVDPVERSADGRVLRLRIAIVLLAAVAVIYSGAAESEFVAYDDPRDVYLNPLVTGGASLDAVRKIFALPRIGGWPVTSMSHMLAWELFGGSPAGHHAVNVLLHAANVLLLFALFARMTRRVWTAAIVAALFAVHPLHVESVAWVSDRKDVLSGFFGLLCLNAYVRYAEQRSPIAYAVVVATFALGLLAKSMLVTLPFLMLLLDAWPLARMQKLPMGRLLLEKLPLFGLALAAGIAIYQIQHPNELPNHTQVSLMWRLVNVPISYVAYLGNAAWPLGLACFYPHPGLSNPDLFSRYALGAAAATAGLLAVTGFAVSLWRTRPWLLVGWLWFLGTLIPVVGIVQVGYAAIADRYVYLPLIGIYCIIAFEAVEAARHYPRARPALIGGGLAVAMLLGALSFRQVGVWKDSYSLFEHALAVTERNSFAHNNLGVVKFRDGQVAGAEREFRAAIAIDTSFPDFHHNLAFALEDVGQLRPAAAEYRAALALGPNSFDSNYQLARTLYRLEEFSAAAEYFELALQIRPRSARARRFMNEARQRSQE